VAPGDTRVGDGGAPGGNRFTLELGGGGLLLPYSGATGDACNVPKGGVPGGLRLKGRGAPGGLCFRAGGAPSTPFILSRSSFIVIIYLSGDVGRLTDAAVLSGGPGGPGRP